MRRSTAFGAGLLSLSLLVSTVALGIPWDLDMADAQSKKAYAHEMKGLPAGVVAQPHVLSPVGFAPNFVRGTQQADALTAPFDRNPDNLAVGEEMYGIYCTPCHGDGENLGPLAEPGRFPAIVKLSGKDGVLNKKTDGHVYLTIRNGSAIMPYFGWAMTDDEMWSIVHYTRSLPNAKFIPPEPPPAVEEEVAQ